MISNASNGIIFWDLDGTVVPDSELRNQRVIQSTLDTFLEKKVLPLIKIDWHECCGHSEDDIFRILVAEGNSVLEEIVTPEKFQNECLKGFRENEPDYTPRKGVIETVIALQSFGIHSAIVSNSEGERVNLALKEAFKIVNLGVSVEEAFPLVVTKDDFGPNQIKPKPSANPYWFALNTMSSILGPTDRKKVLIFEDSPPGTTSAYHFINNRDQVIQFTDVGAPKHVGARHARNMTQCHGTICARFGINKKDFRRAMERVSSNAPGRSPP